MALLITVINLAKWFDSSIQSESNRSIALSLNESPQEKLSLYSILTQNREKLK